MSEKSFNDKLVDLVSEHCDGKPYENMTAEISAEIIQALASMIGKHIAMQCQGKAEFMSFFLEMASSHMFETASSFTEMGQILGDAKAWMPGGTIDSRKIKPPKGWGSWPAAKEISSNK
jgi:hypothetical protein